MNRLCKNCVYGIFQLTEKGNIKRSIAGYCSYFPKKPDLPECVQERYFKWPPSYFAIWADKTSGSNCDCFKIK